ncbi:TRAM domain-containing protein [Halosegnis rubeus]|uniref:TRAM domain-containing protein n=1 Tax=Halosegnis rubeus TaxID=2212850 RepID=A0A5N5U7N8_9EURY|nr:TRAM domain-containing protein [Halosegnis rubeus]KAB7512573.1 TRAM domain-containing protein [Halosegnis rubeus]KAB7514508.1 TRAM domain-containing protein [Halosegnis rubeus]
MSGCPLADQCPQFQERIEGMGCTHYGDRGGAEWCNHYNQPINELKQQPVEPGEEVVITVDDIHESGAGVGRTEDGFIVMVDGILPEARSRVKITKVLDNFARGEELERLELEEDDEEDGDDGEDVDASDEDKEKDETGGRTQRERLGSREDFWGS